MSNTVEATLDDRRKTHGHFPENARVSVGIKEILKLDEIDDPVVREGIDFIVKKLARAASGDPYNMDHYRDIAGFATLILDYLEKEAPEARDVLILRKEKDVSGSFTVVPSD